MNSISRAETTTSIIKVLSNARRKGVRFWSDNGQLRYEAPRGALTHDELQEIRNSKGQIISLLERSTRSTVTHTRRDIRRHTGRAPLSFSQMAYWDAFRLHERPGIRQIASAIRLVGKLNIHALQSALDEVVRRHDALRTQIVVRDGEPGQEVFAPGRYELPVTDDDRKDAIQKRIDALILEPINLAVDALLGVELLRIGDREHVLLLAMEHIISDAFSLGVLIRDLFTAYSQAVKGVRFSLPTVDVQFCDYAAWQRNNHLDWLEKHGAHWDRYLSKTRRLRFPQDFEQPSGPAVGWGIVPFEIDRALKEKLTEWCRQKQTTVVLSVFSAFVATVLRWCDARESVFSFQTDGRFGETVENSIGYFAAEIYLRLKLLETDTFVDLIRRVTAEYCEAQERADFAYLGSQRPRPEFAKNSAFNWVPQAHAIGFPELEGTADAIPCSAIPFVHPMLKGLSRDNEPVMLLYDTADGINGGVYYPLGRFSGEMMERFKGRFLRMLGAMVGEGEAGPIDVVCVAQNTSIDLAKC